MRAENVCLLLGAGVSKEQSLPDWLGLVDDVKDFFGIKLNVDNSNLIESIGIIEDSITKEMFKSLKNAHVTYNDVQRIARRQIALAVKLSMLKKLKSLGKTKQAFQEELNKKEGDISSTLMGTMIDCIHERTVNGMLSTIITYNFDDYLEYGYKLKYPKDNKYVGVYNINDTQHLPSGSGEKRVSIYHVHGCIPAFELFYEEKYDSEWIDEYLDKGIIFSGNDYNMLMDSNIVGWSNMIQYICYSQLPVIISGFSLTDANFRLILRRMAMSHDRIKQIKVLFGYEAGKSNEKAIMQREVAFFY